MADVVRFRLLGPVEAWVGSRQAPVRGPRQRAVLAMLCLRVGRPVSMSELVDVVWGDAPPATARQQIHSTVSALRQAIGGGIETRSTGYELVVDPERVDTVAFETLVARAQRAAEEQPERAAAMLTEALNLWRGPALGGAPGLLSDGVRLDERRMAVLEERIDLELRLGQHAALVAELSGLVAQHPLRERLVGQLMVALYRCGRTPEALDMYRLTEKRLSAELGLDPGRELRQLELAVLREDPSLDPPSHDVVPGTTPRPAPAARGVPTVVPAQLPVDVPGFVGRRDEFARLDANLTGDGGITVVSGTAGVGKTALVVRWAHRVADRFVDGQLYVNLRGFEPSGSTMSPGEAVRAFLDAFDVPPQRIPEGLHAQVGLYRSLLAGKRVLVILDNARDVGQVRPLLPGTRRCLAVVTSRHQLPGLVAAEGAVPLTLDLLTVEEARELLVRRLGSDRVAAERRAADEIIDRCARLPLALAIVAARAVTHPGFSLAALAGELREARGGLDAFAGEDPATDVRAVLSWSYRALSDPAAGLFRLLGLHPGSDISAPAAASLVGLPVEQVRPLLGEVARAHLLTEHIPGRYSLHDLLRAYAAEQAHTHDSEEIRTAAVHRLLDHYLHTALTATQLLYPQRDPIGVAPAQPGVVPETLADAQQALAWFTAEHAVLLAAVELAAGAGFDSHTWQLAWSLAGYFHRRGHWEDWLATHNLALAAAERLGDRLGQAHTHRNLGRAAGWLARNADAEAHLLAAHDLYAAAGDQAGQAHAHLGLTVLLDRQGRLTEALQHAEQALALYRIVGHPIWPIGALNSVGWCHARLGNYEEALVCCEVALAEVRKIDDPYSEAAICDSLGYAHHHLGNHDQATACFERALQLYRDSGDRFNEADVLDHLGDNHHAAGHLDAARNAWQRAADVLDGLGHPNAAHIRAKLHQPDPSG